MQGLGQREKELGGVKGHPRRQEGPNRCRAGITRFGRPLWALRKLDEWRGESETLGRQVDKPSEASALGRLLTG
jgi:hypothetical protein